MSTDYNYTRRIEADGGAVAIAGIAAVAILYVTKTVGDLFKQKRVKRVTGKVGEKFKVEIDANETDRVEGNRSSRDLTSEPYLP